MSKPTTEEMNRVIAEFMGAELDGDNWHITGREWTVSAKRFPGNLHYHTSWDWLMPVVEKIAQMEYAFNLFTERSSAVSIHNGVGMIGHMSIPFIHIDKSREGWTLMQMTYEAVYQFIIWYNQQTTPNEPTTKR